MNYLFNMCWELHVLGNCSEVIPGRTALKKKCAISVVAGSSVKDMRGGIVKKTARSGNPVPAVFLWLLFFFVNMTTSAVTTFTAATAAAFFLPAANGKIYDAKKEKNDNSACNPTGVHSH